MYKYKATITSVYDGDTCTADIDLGFYMILRKVKVRLWGINTPEIRGGTDEEKAKGREVRDYLKERVLNQEVVLVSRGKGKYGRWLCEIYAGDTNLNDEMLEKGMARPYMRD